jgi:hypothetical protein
VEGILCQHLDHGLNLFSALKTSPLKLQFHFRDKKENHKGRGLVSKEGGV